MTAPVPPPEFTPERAASYVEATLPELLARASRQLGEPGADGTVEPEPSAGAARLALLSAAEVLDGLASVLPIDVSLPHRAALARLQQLFAARHPNMPLAMPRRDRPATYAERVSDAWDEGVAAAHQPPAPAATAPDAGLPSRGSALD